MPKIFLIKDRLQQQQARLQEASKTGLNLEDDHHHESRTLDLRKSSFLLPEHKDDNVTLDLRTTSRIIESYSSGFFRRASLGRVSPVEVEEEKPLSLTVKDKDKFEFRSPLHDEPRNRSPENNRRNLPSISHILPRMGRERPPFPSPYNFIHLVPPQERPLDYHVPKPSLSPRLPPFKDVRLRRTSSPMEYENSDRYYDDEEEEEEEEEENLVPYDLSTRKLRSPSSPRSVSPRSLPPYMESMKITQCTNAEGGGSQSSGSTSSSQQSCTNNSYTDLSQATLTFFGIIGGGDKGGVGGSGGGGDGGDMPFESMPSDSPPPLPPMPSLMEPQVYPAPEHCRHLNGLDRSPAFPAPALFIEALPNKYAIHLSSLNATSPIQQITIDTQLPSQTQMELDTSSQQFSPLSVASPLSSSISPLSQSITQSTLIHSPSDTSSLEATFSSQTQVPLVSSTEVQNNWNERLALSPQFSNGSYPARPTSAATASPPLHDIQQEVPLQVRVSILQQRLGLPEESPVEFVNGGHGIKNPLVNQERSVEVEKAPIIEDDPSKFACRICSKVFSLQRLLNRHMKCHSDVKRYLCTFCGKGFNDTFDLKRHTRTHTGVRPYKCNFCEKSFTQRCSLESHCLKVHGVQHSYAYKERRSKVYVCEECGHTTGEPESHYVHLKENHPYSPALLKFYDKRHFKFQNTNFTNMLLMSQT